MLPGDVGKWGQHCPHKIAFSFREGGDMGERRGGRREGGDMGERRRGREGGREEKGRGRGGGKKKEKEKR